MQALRASTVRHLSRYRKAAPLDAGSIFSSREPAWKHIFGDSPAKAPNLRRQTITETEKATIRELLDDVFKARESHSPDAIAKAESLAQALESNMKTKPKPGSHLVEPHGALQVALDELKQAIDSCPTKIALLLWAQAHVFSVLEQSSPTEPFVVQPLHRLQHLVPLLMRDFRERFDDPHLALFIFKAVRHHSTRSYVYGCSVSTYNELITLLWDSFRDLQGIREALEEMLINSVEANRQTEVVTERACRQAMDDKLWLDHTDEGHQVAMSTLSTISDLLLDLMAAKDSKYRAGEWGRRKRDLIERDDEEDSRDELKT